MGEILGVGATHYPPGLVPDEYKPWPLARMLQSDERIPPHLKDPANWPEEMRLEWGDDEGITSHKAHRVRVLKAFQKIRDEIDAFNPDFVLIWGDDQYENFKEDIIPPFCVLAYDQIEFQPFKRTRGRPNIWGEPEDKVFRWPGHQEAGHLETDDVTQMPLDPPQRHERPPPADIPLPIRVDREVRQLADLPERQTADTQQQRDPAEVGPCRRPPAQEPGQREEHHDAKAVQHLVAMMVLHKICSSIFHSEITFRQQIQGQIGCSPPSRISKTGGSCAGLARSYTIGAPDSAPMP